jgi:hypothetical protein
MYRFATIYATVPLFTFAESETKGIQPNSSRFAPILKFIQPIHKPNYKCLLSPVTVYRAQVMGFFYQSTQRHYRRLILLLILLHVSVVRPSSGRNILPSIIFFLENGRTTETCSSISSKINLR